MQGIVKAELIGGDAGSDWFRNKIQTQVGAQHKCTIKCFQQHDTASIQSVQKWQHLFDDDRDGSIQMHW